MGVRGHLGYKVCRYAVFGQPVGDTVSDETRSIVLEGGSCHPSRQDCKQSTS